MITEEGEGQFRKSAIGIDLRDDERIQTRAENDVNVDDFVITFTKEGSTTPSAVYRFGDMPDVVTLAAGTYTVKAELGEDVIADWNSPYYSGESEKFTIEAGKITDTIGDIVCKMENVKVSIIFAPLLSEKMSDDSYVEVRVCPDGTEALANYLRFKKSDQLRGNTGHFHHEEGVSLIATFRGMVEGAQFVKNVSYPNIQKGYHYQITFKLNTQDTEHRGDLTGGLSVDASVTVTDVERNVNVEEDEILPDDERPKEEDPEDPNPPTPPTQNGPTIEPEAPISLDKVNDVNNNSHVVINITSETGITEFKVNIISEDLAGMAPDVLDLVTPGENLDFLQEIGLLANGKETVQGDKKVTFDVSGFMGMLCALGGDKYHTFRLTVSDASGTVVKELKLHTL